MNFELIPALALFAFTASGTPGPNNIMLLASGANFGLRRTLPHMLGIVLGSAVMVFCVGIFLIQMFDAYPWVREALRVLSIGYLIFLAYKVAIAAAPQDADAHPRAKPFTFLQAALFQWVNPKAVTIAVAAISAFTPPAHPWESVLLVSLVFLVVTLPCVTIWVVLGMQLRRWLNDPKKLRIFNFTAATLLVLSLYPVVFVK